MFGVTAKPMIKLSAPKILIASFAVPANLTRAIMCHIMSIAPAKQPTQRASVKIINGLFFMTNFRPFHVEILLSSSSFSVTKTLSLTLNNNSESTRPIATHVTPKILAAITSPQRPAKTSLKTFITVGTKPTARPTIGQMSDLSCWFGVKTPGNILNAFDHKFHKTSSGMQVK